MTEFDIPTGPLATVVYLAVISRCVKGLVYGMGIEQDRISR